LEWKNTRQFRTKICATAKHAHTTTPFFASRYREIGKNKVQIKHSNKIPLLAKGSLPPLIAANAELTGISACHVCTLWHH